MRTMKNRYLVSLCAVAAAMLTACGSSSQQQDQEELSQYVEPRIGTAHCRWFHFTPGAMPFGMAKPGPATNGSLGNKQVGKQPVMIIETIRSKVSPVCMSFRWAVLC